MAAEVDIRALAVELAALLERQTQPPLLTAEEAGDLLAVPASWGLSEARAKRIPHIKLGRCVRFRRDELEAWLERRGQ